MPKYEIEDPKTGLKVELEGDRPPTEQEIANAINDAYNVKFPGETTTPQANAGITPSGTVNVSFEPSYIPPPPGPEPEIAGEAIRGFLGSKSRARGAAEKAAYAAGESGTQMILSTAGQALGGGVGPVAAAGSGAGAGLGVAIQEGARALAKQAGLEATAPESIGDVAKKVGAEAAGTAALSFAIPKAVQGMAALGREGVKRAAGTITGVSEEAFERLMARPKEVLKQIGESPSESARQYADLFKDAIEENYRIAGEKYDTIIKRVLGNKALENKRFDLFKGLGNDLAKIQKEFGFGLPNRIGDIEEANEFLRIKRSIEGMKSATAEDLYYLQRNLGQLAHKHRDTSLGAAFKQLDDKANEYVGARIKGIKKANDLYRPAKEMMKELEKKIGKIEDLPAKIESAYRRNTIFTDSLEKIADTIPAARKALESLLDAQAAKPFEPRIAKIPRTGMQAALAGTGAGLGFGVAMGNPAALAASAVTAPFLFPRGLASLLAAASKYAPEAGKAGRSLTPAASTGLVDWLLRRQQPAR